MNIYGYFATHSNTSELFIHSFLHSLVLLFVRSLVRSFIHSFILYYYTFKLHSCFLLIDIYQLILNVWKPWHHFRRISWTIRRSYPKKKKIIGRWWRNHLKAAKITKQQKRPAAVWNDNRLSLSTANLFLHLSLLWTNNKTIIGFGLRTISRIILQTSVNVIHLSLRLRQITLTLVWIILDIMLSLIQELFIIFPQRALQR